MASGYRRGAGGRGALPWLVAGASLAAACLLPLRFGHAPAPYGDAAFPAARDINAPAATAPPAAARDPAHNLRALLASGATEAAVAYYDRAYTGGDQRLAGQLHRALHEHAADLIRQRDPARAIALLGAYLALFYRDHEAWFMLGQAYRDDNQLRRAIGAFVHARQDSAPDAGMLETVGLQLNWTISLYVQELEEQRRPHDIVALYDYLARVEPDNPHHYLSLAGAYVAAGRLSDALGHLAYVAQDAAAGPRAREMMDEILARATN